MWGTSKKGTIPTNEILDEAGLENDDDDSDVAVAAAGGGGGGGGTLLSGVAGGGGNTTVSTMMYDIPVQVDVRRALGLDALDAIGGVSIKQIECGPTGTALVLSDGRCYTFGENDMGQLGHGHKNDVPLPTLLSPPLSTSPLASVGVSSIHLGKQFSAIIDLNNDLYTFGYGGSTFSGMGNLGHGDGEPHLYPKLVESLVEDGCYADKVVVGKEHMTVLTTEGEVLTSGVGSYGRLGNLEPIDQLYLEPVELICGENVVDLTGGSAFTLALTKEGVVHGWGRNDKGQLGTGMGFSVDVYSMESLPRPIESQLEGRRVTKVSAGHTHAACITDNGELFMWGSQIHFEPVLMTSLLHTRCVDVECGQNYTLAKGEDGKLYSFGKGKTGVLGQGSVRRLNEPTLVEGIGSNKKVVSMSAGFSHVACLVEEEEESKAEEE